MSLGTRFGSTARVLALGSIAWLVVASLLLLQLLPRLPQSALHWAFFIALGPPLFVALEVLAGWLLSPEHGSRLSSRQFSVIRVLVAIPVALALMALSSWLASIVTSSGAV